MYSKTHSLLPFIALAFIACSDNVNALQEITWDCSESGRPSDGDRPCPPGKRFVQGACEAMRCDATEEPLCCPGTVCNQGGECAVPISKIRACTDDTACDGGQQCLNQPALSVSSKTCGFPKPNIDQECPIGTSLFNQRCVAQSPCNARCRSGWVCNVGLNSCERAPAQTPSCEATCGDGQIMVYSDPQSMLFDQCCAVSCECADLPPLMPGDWGRFVSSARNDARIFASGYDTTYGDLVVAEYDPNTLLRTRIRYVDGVPETGLIKAHPNGPRHGLIEPGPNVGTHSAMALRNDRPVIVYHDETSNALKIATEQDDGTWVLGVIDNALQPEFVLGTHTSILVDTTGAIHITYFAQSQHDDGTFFTSPIYARSQVLYPRTPSDWERVAIEPITACNQVCDSDSACVQTAQGAQCMPKATSCTTCGCDQACIGNSESAQCMRKAPNFYEPPVLVHIPEGNGSFTSLAFHNNMPTVIYHDHTLGHLRGAVANFEWNAPSLSTFTSTVMDCGDGIPTGIQTSLRVSPLGDLIASYTRPNGYGAYVFHGSSIFTGRITEIDDGIRDRNTHLLGGSTTVGFTQAGRTFITYGDLTDNNTLMAFEMDGTFGHRSLLENGAFGSAQSMVIDSDDRAHILGYRRILAQPSVAGLSLTTEDLRSYPAPR